MKRLAIVALVVLPGVAAAHEFWLEPSTFRPARGQQVTVALRVGMKLNGESFPRVPQLIDRFLVKGKGAEVLVDGPAFADPAGTALVSQAGLSWIGYQSHPFPLTLEAKTFEEEYLREEGLERIIEERARRGQSAEPGRERFYRCAKALLDAGGAPVTGVFDRPLAFTLELVPKKNPYRLRPGGDLPLTLLFRGKPAPNVLVTALSKEDPDQRVRARTDGKGQVTLRLGRPGFWLVKAVQMEAAPADSGFDWESWWASITFELSGAPGK